MEDKIEFNKDAVEWIKKFQETQQKDWQRPARPCPDCGRCPTCGRGGWHTRPYYWDNTSY